MKLEQQKAVKALYIQQNTVTYHRDPHDLWQGDWNMRNGNDDDDGIDDDDDVR